MKIAKKVLALVMAVAMIGCFAAMAFASDLVPATAKFELVLNDKGNVDLYAKDCTGLASADFVFTFDPAVVKSVRALKGADAKLVNEENFLSNTFTTESNNADLAAVTYAFYFKENLWAAEKWADAEENVGGVDVNAANFHVATFNVTYQDGKTAADLVVKATAKASFTNGLKEAEEVKETVDSFAINAIEKKVEETTAAPVETTAAPETTTAAPETTTEAPTSPEVTTGDNAGDTGDTGVLAIAAGVVALAGAAFVVSKKRK